MPSKAIAAINRKKNLENQALGDVKGQAEATLAAAQTGKSTEISPNLSKKLNQNITNDLQVSKTESGSFQKDKGGYVTEAGKVYPTSNPDFVPAAQGTTTQIKFNKDRSIDYTPKGSNEPIRLTQEEYNVLQGEKGNVTSNVQQILTKENQNIPNIDLMTKQEVQQVTGNSVDLSQGVLGETISLSAQKLEKLSSFLPEFLRFGTKKSLDVTKAEQGFADYNFALDAQIDLYNKGKLPFSVVQKTFQDAEREIIKLQSQTKGMGQLDLRFWLDKGAEIEAQVERELTSLQTKRAMLGI